MALKWARRDLVLESNNVHKQSPKGFPPPGLGHISFLLITRLECVFLYSKVFLMVMSGWRYVYGNIFVILSLSRS